MCDLTWRLIPTPVSRTRRTRNFPAVTPGEHSVRSRRRDGSVEGESAAVRHGVAGVYAKIEQHLVDLAFVAVMRRRSGFQLEMEINCLGKCRLQHPLQVPDERVEMDRRKRASVWRAEVSNC